MLDEYMSNELEVDSKKYFKISGCRYISKDEYAKIMQPTALTQLRVNNYYWLKRRDEVADCVVRIVALILACLFLSYMLPNLFEKMYEKKIYVDCMDSMQDHIDNMEYDKAIKALTPALNLKTYDRVECVEQIGYLYACMNEYDKGLDYLEKEYKKNNDSRIYEKIEELKKDKSILDYNKYLTLADDASHSITEDDRLSVYTKAIDAKPDESKAYLLVSNIYVAKGEYDKAINLLSSGVSLCDKTQGIVAKQTRNILASELKKIDKILNSTEYNDIFLEICSAYLKGDLETAILKYKAAKAINHRDYRLYVVMSNTYTNENKYDEAIATLNEGIKVLSVYKNNDLLKEKYDYLVNLKRKVGTIKKYVLNYSGYYKTLLDTCAEMKTKNNFNDIEKMLISNTYSTMASSSDVTYYNALGKFVDKMSNGMGIAVYKNKYMYYGNWKNGKRHGAGYYIASTKADDKITTYVYAGTWVNGYPTGKGTVNYYVKNKKGIVYKTITTGTFLNGYEHGKMSITKIDKANYGNKILKLNYTTNNGVVEYLKDNKGKVQKTSAGDNIIGYYYVNGKKSEAVATKKKLIWKVNGLGIE